MRRFLTAFLILGRAQAQGAVSPLSTSNDYALSGHEHTLDAITNPVASRDFYLGAYQLRFSFDAPVAGAFFIEAKGAFTGDLMHIHQHTGNPGPGTYLMHMQSADPDVIPLWIQSGNALGVIVDNAVQAGSFIGPLTGNATTATALAADGGDCGPGLAAQGVDAAGAAQGCFTPAGTYVHPAAHAPSIITQDASNRFVTDTEKATWNGKLGAIPAPGIATLGGVNSKTCSGTDKISTIATDGSITCTGDVGGTYTLPALTATVLGGVMGRAGVSLTCSGTDKATGFDAGGALLCGADQGGTSAPVGAKYILQQADAALASAQSLGALSTGILKSTTTTGVLSIAASGTDYAPATSGTAILKGSGAGGFAAAASGTDYGPPTSGLATGMLKNTTGTGAHSIAVAGDLPGGPYEPAGAYSGVGTCTNQFARVLNNTAAPTCASVDLSADTAATALPVTKGGTAQTAWADNEMLVGTGTNTVARIALPGSACNSSVQKLTWDPAGNGTWGCGTDQTGTGSGTLTQLTGTWASSGTINVLGIVGTAGVPLTSPTYGAAAPFSFKCMVSTTRASTSNGPRYGIQSSGSVTRISWTSRVGLAGTPPARTENINQLYALATATCAAGCSSAITASTLASVFDDTIEGTGVMNAGGTLSLVMAPSAGAVDTAQIGSYCIWY